MHLQTENRARRGGVFALVLLVPGLLLAQATSAKLSGTVQNAAGEAISGAAVTAESAAGGASAKTETDAKSEYGLTGLAPGTYTVRVTASGFASKEATATVTASGQQTLNFSLAAAGSQQELPNAPSAAPPASGQGNLSLQSLGFTPQQTQSNPQLQARLNRRTEMLKIHQRLGLITAAPMLADLITGPMAKAKGRNGQTITEPTQANLDLHAALGSATAALYFTTAYYAIFAPKIPGTHKHGAIRVHEALMFIHGPGMILTPILGAMAFQQEQSGEKPHGIASYHGTVAYVTAIAYGASMVAIAWPIHLKFWEKK
jgi:Carboxypeptidase regulatory-like domain